MGPVHISDSSITFEGYDYPGASVYSAGVLAFDDVMEIDPLCAPPEVRTRRRETVFVPAVHRDSLRHAAELHGIPVVRRVDIWGLILEPFLDTEVSAEADEAILLELERNGISREECQRIRRRHRRCMWSYNIRSGLWEWCHLGLADLLDARRGVLSGWMFRDSERRFRQLYG